MKILADPMKTFLSAALCASMLTAFLVLPSMSGSAQTRRPVKGSPESKTGEKAVEELRRTRGYDSLMQAFKSASGQSFSEKDPTENVIGTQQAKLTASGGAAFEGMGWSVAVSGNTAVIGAPYADVTGSSQQGSAYVFTRSGTAWTQQARLIASDGATGDNFGFSVAVSGDTAVIGAYKSDTMGNTDQGAAYVFTRSGTTWTEQQKLTAASDGVAGDYFSQSVAVSGDTVVIGAPYDGVAFAFQGSAYVFTRSGTTWTEQQKLTAADYAAFDLLGWSVAVDGDTAVIGANNDDIGANTDQGSAYVFTRSGTTWTQQQKLTASDGADFDNLGSSVAMDGDTAVIGAPFKIVNGGFDRGSAYVFTRSGTTWTQQQKLTASDGADFDNLGLNVAVSGDTAIIGALYHDAVATDAGAAYMFTRSGTTWTQQQKLTASDGASGDFFGGGVAVSGNTVVVGANGAMSTDGAAYVFLTSSTTAGGASLDGRVRTPSGAGLRNAIVSVTDQQGNMRTARTGAFGGFRFEGLPVGEGYVVSVKSKNYTFAPRFVQLLDDLSGFEITPSAPLAPAGVTNNPKVRLR